MPKRILVLVGSPRKGGNTELLADAFLEGARESGNTVTKYHVRGKSLMPCVDCQYCYTHSGCALIDGMDEVYKLLSETDLLVFASPVYFWGFPAQLKALIDPLHNPARKKLPHPLHRAFGRGEDDEEECSARSEKRISPSRIPRLGGPRDGLGGGLKEKGAIVENAALDRARVTRQEHHIKKTR